MPSHTWNEVGRWADSVRANLEAWHSDLKASIGEGFAIYPEHNLHMLLYAASMDGQGAVAMQAGKDYAKLTGDNFYQVLTLLRFGRFDEIVTHAVAIRSLRRNRDLDQPAEKRDHRRPLGLRAGLRTTPAGRGRLCAGISGAGAEDC
jgi:hypothetical protein